ncbi:MAG: SH3 domain-containing protein [Pseudomonadota bacterium]|nr:SH3 domain-containing protein [Pseudomonadota bacterium]
MTRPPILRLYMGFSLLVLLTALAPSSASAQSPQSFEAFPEPQNSKRERPNGACGLPLPRFVSIKSDAANVRRGPGPDFPLLWQYQRRNLPLEVVAEYDDWRRVRDHHGEEGWMNAPLLSGARTVIVRRSAHAVTLRAAPDATGGVVALVQPGVVGTLEACKGDWCEVEVDRYDGWLQRNQIWGIYPFEFRD